MGSEFPLTAVQCNQFRILIKKPMFSRENIGFLYSLQTLSVRLLFFQFLIDLLFVLLHQQEANNANHNINEDRGNQNG